MLWQCTTCGACENQCPVGIEHLPILIGARLGPEPREHWNGKIEDPLILAAAARAPETLALDPLLPPGQHDVMTACGR